MNTRERGNITESKVIAKLMEEGFSVYLPFSDGERVDMVIEKDDIYRIQVKTAWEMDGGDKIKFKGESSNTYWSESKSKKYDKSEIDAFIVYYPDEDDYFWVDVDEVGSNMIIRYKNASNQTSKINWASEYRL